MSLPNSPIEILKLLDKSNCKECGYPTCLAFASAVFKGQNQLDKCTRLNRDIIEKYGTEQIAQNPTESDPDESLEKLKAKLAG